jgi:hypothetical protein
MRNSILQLCCILLVSVCSSCHHVHHSGNVSISIREDEGTYKMYTYFNKDKTARIHHYINQQLGGHSSPFVHSRMDGMLTINDKTSFYIKSEPGELEIELDKEKNSCESYQQVKRMCEGIKRVIENKLVE